MAGLNDRWVFATRKQAELEIATGPGNSLRAGEQTGKRPDRRADPTSLTASMGALGAIAPFLATLAARVALAAGFARLARAARTTRVALAALAALASPALAQDRFIVMASTTSTEQSGLFKVLLPAFKQATGIDVRVVAVGSGQALDAGRRGDADVVFVHDTPAEEKFVAEGYATARRDVMFNDFVLVGPKGDPAGARGQDVVTGLAKVAASAQPFISRGDKSGTHAAELRLWQLAGLDIDRRKPVGYKACGCGMGPALNIAASTQGYTLADRGTWLAFRNRGDLALLVEGDRRLFNPYGVMVVNPARHPHVKAALAQQFADWVVSPAGQQTIARYTIGGEPVFFPNAKR